MDTKSYDSAVDLPQSCWTAAGQTANSTKGEGCCGFSIADISESCKSKIDELEKELNNSCGKKIALVAYQAK